MSITKYEPIFQEVNIDIQKFNLFLKDEFTIAPLDTSNPESCSVIANVPWDSQVWPGSGLPGVYILCAYQESRPDRLGAYIGKASLSNIGNRLWSHLNPYRSTGIYKRNDGSGEPFIIETIMAIAFRDLQMRPLVSALEEFVITGVQSRVHLLNSTGVSRET